MVFQRIEMRNAIMFNRTKRIAVIQDLSCIGRCSLGVAISILPAMGAETAVLPTAILSCHTAFESFTFLDFAAEAEKIMAKWQELQLRFDAIYIGYLGSLKLIHLAERFIDIFRESGARVILDPAFGDHGALYTGFDEAYVRGMKALCRKADIILPNMTEACFLLDLPYGDDAAHSQLAQARAENLIGGDLRNVLITSCRFPENRTGLICVGDQRFAYPHEHLSLACHGSGDVFASVFAGLMLICDDVRRSACAAADFTCDCIRHSMQCADHRWYGVDYEAMIPELTRRVEAFRAQG